MKMTPEELGTMIAGAAGHTPIFEDAVKIGVAVQTYVDAQVAEALLERARAQVEKAGKLVDVALDRLERSLRKARDPD